MPDPPKGGSWSDAHDALANAQGHATWEAWCHEIEDELGWKVCGAKAGRSDDDGPGYPWRPCRRVAGWGIEGQDWGRCRSHGQAGGNASLGPANANWNGGGSSKAVYRMRGSMAETYERLAESVEDFFDLEMEARALQTRMVDLWERMPESPVTPRLLREVADDMDDAMADFRDTLRRVARGQGDPQEVLDAISDLEDALDTVRSGPLSDARLQADSFEEWYRLVDKKRLLSRTQSLREARRYGPVTWADVLVVVDRVRVGVMRYVPDEDKPDAMRFFRRMTERPAVEAGAGG